MIGNDQNLAEVQVYFKTDDQNHGIPHEVSHASPNPDSHLSRLGYGNEKNVLNKVWKKFVFLRASWISRNLL
jgi:hypothetical protein